MSKSSGMSAGATSMGPGYKSGRVKNMFAKRERDVECVGG